MVNQFVTIANEISALAESLHNAETLDMMDHEVDQTHKVLLSALDSLRALVDLAKHE